MRHDIGMIAVVVGVVRVVQIDVDGVAVDNETVVFLAAAVGSYDAAELLVAVAEVDGREQLGRPHRRLAPQRLLDAERGERRPDRKLHDGEHPGRGGMAEGRLSPAGDGERAQHHLDALGAPRGRRVYDRAVGAGRLALTRKPRSGRLLVPRAGRSPHPPTGPRRRDIPPYAPPT